MRTPALSLMAVMLAAPFAVAQGVDRLWTDNCAKCHGPKGEGGGAGTRSLLTKDYEGNALDRRFFDSVKNGLPDGGMPAFGETMSDPQVWATVNYIRELQARARRERGERPKAVAGVYASSHLRFRVEDVIPKGLDVPWAVEFLPGGDLLVTNRSGALVIARNGSLTRIEGTPRVRNRGQGGLMDVTLHPDYSRNGWVYLSYSEPADPDNPDAGKGMTKIIRGKITSPADGAGPRWTDQQTIFEARREHYLSGDVHFGSKIVFDPSDPSTLYFSIGERGRQEFAQDLSRPNGKVYRVKDDGAIPTDNPFADAPNDAYRAIWSFGHRNPQGLAFDLEGNLWDTEHAPRGGDELNLVLKGRNYGWPVVSFGINYSGAPFVTPWPDVEGEKAMALNIVMPSYVWLPSIGACGLAAVSGKAGEAFAPWKGDLLAGGLSGSNVDRFRVKVEKGAGVVVEREELLVGIGRVRDVACGPDGFIYVVINGPDKVMRLAPAPTGAGN